MTAARRAEVDRREGRGSEGGDGRRANTRATGQREVEAKWEEDAPQDEGRRWRERETEEEEERTGSTGLIHDIWMSNPPDAV